MTRNNDKIDQQIDAQLLELEERYNKLMKELEEEEFIFAAPEAATQQEPFPSNVGNVAAQAGSRLNELYSQHWDSLYSEKPSDDKESYLKRITILTELLATINRIMKRIIP